jgi:hypothetical protein
MIVGVSVTGVSAVVLLLWAIGATAYNNSVAKDDACYLEACRDLGQLTEAQLDEAVRNGSFGLWRADMVSRYGEDVVVRTGARIEQEAATSLRY